MEIVWVVTAILSLSPGIPISRMFTPSADDIRRAQELIAAHAAHQAAGTGVFQLGGKMIDMPMIRAAEAVIARARTAGLVEGD